MQLEELSPDVFEHILTFISIKDILLTTLCSKKLRQMCSSNHVWILCAKRDYLVEMTLDNTPVDSSIVHPVKQFYLKILQPLGPCLLKPWILRNNDPYGGLVKFLYHNFRIYVVLLHPPPYPYTYEALQPEIIFSVGLDETNNDQTWLHHQGWFRWNASSDKSHQIRIRIPRQDKDLDECSGESKSELMRPSKCLEYVHKTNCVEVQYRPTKNQSTNYINFEEFRMRLGCELDDKYVKNRFEANAKFWDNSVKILVPLKSKKFIPPICPIEPGLFKATYAGRGVEIIHIFYEENQPIVTGLYITSNEHVPSNEILFQAFLDKPIFAGTKEGRKSFAVILKYMEPNSPLFVETKYIAQIKRKFSNCQHGSGPDDIDLVRDGFEHKIVGYHSCQFAYQHLGENLNFCSNLFLEGNWIIFTNDVFALVWTSTKTMAIFERIEENLSNVSYKDIFKNEPNKDTA